MKRTDDIACGPETKRSSGNISKRNIALVGGTGWIGKMFRHYVRNLEISSLINIVDLSRNKIRSLNSSSDKIRDYLEENEVIAVVNLAGGDYSGLYNQFCNDSQKAWLGDFELPRMLVKSVQNTGIELIQLSTGDVYDYHQIPSYSTNDCTFSESDLCNAVFQSDIRAPFFSGMKFNAEQIIRMHPYHYIFRIKHPIDMISNPKNLINIMLSDSVSVFPLAKESITFLPDLFRAIMMVVLPDESIGYGIYHIAVPDCESLVDVAKLIINKSPSTLEWSFSTCPINEYMNLMGQNISFSCLNTNKFKAIGGHLTPFAYIKDQVIPTVLNKYCGGSTGSH